MIRNLPAVWHLTLPIVLFNTYDMAEAVVTINPSLDE